MSATTSALTGEQLARHVANLREVAAQLYAFAASGVPLSPRYCRRLAERLDQASRPPAPPRRPLLRVVR